MQKGAGWADSGEVQEAQAWPVLRSTNHGRLNRNALGPSALRSAQIQPFGWVKAGFFASL